MKVAAYYTCTQFGFVPGDKDDRLEAAGLSCGGSGRSDGGWEDGRMLLLHFFDKSLLGYFLARASFYGGGSQLGFVGGIAESSVEVVCFLLFSATTLL